MKKFVFTLLCSGLVGCLENSFWRVGKGDDFDNAEVSPTAQPSFEPSEEDSGEEEEESSAPSQEEPSTDSAEPSTEEPTTEEPSEEENPGDSSSSPQTPQVGDIIINELMVNPAAVEDRKGEWVELWNRSEDWLTLAGFRLADNGVDDIEITAVSMNSLVVAPQGFLVICSDASFWNNGGVDCHGSVPYDTFGDGFSLSNTADEVKLLRPTGGTIDAFSYTSNFSVEGTSLGVDPQDADATGNNSQNNWCQQWGFLPQGDAGNPGQENEPCF